MKKIPYLTPHPGKDGGVRYFWQPSKALREQGYRLKRLSDDLAEAEEQARQINADIACDRTRRALAPAQAPVEEGRTVRALIVRYQAHRLYTNKPQSTQQFYNSYLRLIDAWAGEDDVGDITPQEVEKLYAKYCVSVPNPPGPALLKPTAKAVSAVKTLQALFKCGVKLGWVKANPASHFGLETPERQVEVVLWTREMVRRFVEVADRLGRDSIGTAVLINEWLGQREADIIKLPSSAFAGLAADVRQQKTDARVRLPVRLVPHLAARIDEEMERRRTRKVLPLDPRQDTFILSEQTCRPYTRRNFAERVAAIAAVASDEARECGNYELACELYLARFCWLRHTAVTRLAEAGCTLPEIAEVTGHSLRGVAEIIRHYLVRTGKMAEAAFRKRLAADGLGELANKLLDEEDALEG